MTPQSALIELLERVGAASGRSVRFSEQELIEWPIAAVTAMKKQGLLTQANPAASAVCPGCERECVMTVHVVPDGAGDPDAFIVCDKRSDINRVPVSLNRLEQWQATGAAIARLLTKLLRLHGPGSDGAESGQWEVGRFKGVKHAGHLVLLADGQLRFKLAGHEAALSYVLTLTGDGFVVDVRTLRGCVDHPVAGGGNTETATQRRLRIAARIDFLKAKGDTSFLKTVAAEEGITKSRVQQILKGGSESKDAQIGASIAKGSIPRRR